MRIQVITTGLLGQYLPSGSARNRAVLEAAEDATPLVIMEQLGMPLDAAYLVTLNGTLVHSQNWSKQSLKEDDVVTIMTPLRGG